MGTPRIPVAIDSVLQSLICRTSLTSDIGDRPLMR
jgi:hypothetical protein